MLRLLNTCFRSDETDLVATRGGAIVVIGNHEACVVGPRDEVRVHTGHDGYYGDRIQRVPNPVSRIILLLLLFIIIMCTGVFPGR